MIACLPSVCTQRFLRQFGVAYATPTRTVILDCAGSFRQFPTTSSCPVAWHLVTQPASGIGPAKQSPIRKLSLPYGSQVHTTANCSSGAIRVRSAGSLVMTAWPARCAHNTTCASTMSAVDVRPSNKPTAVASGPLSGIRSVLACRISRESRACRAGLRIACANAVAGIVIRIPRSAARAISASTRRSLRSKAIRPPASKVIPFTRRSLFVCVSSLDARREARRPRRAPLGSRGRLFVAARLRA